MEQYIYNNKIAHNNNVKICCWFVAYKMLLQNVTYKYILNFVAHKTSINNIGKSLSVYKNISRNNLLLV